MVFQLGAGTERARYTSLVRVFFKNTNLSNIYSDGEINRDHKNGTPDRCFVVFSSNFATVKKCQPNIRKGTHFLVVCFGRIRCRLSTRKNHLLMLNCEILVQ